MSRIIRGVHTAREIALTGKPVDLENEFKSGLNANLAESLAALKNNSHDITVELFGLWDRTLPYQTDIDAPVVIEERTFDTLASLGKSLRGSHVSHSVTIEGTVQGLTRDEGDDDDTDECIVTVRIKPGTDIPARSVKVLLSPEDYSNACNAHRDRKQVSISGTLDRPEGSKSWMILNYQNFRILS